jgi:hypothetical protein
VIQRWASAKSFCALALDGGPGAAGVALLRHALADGAQIVPGGLEDQGVAQGLVGAIGVERPAVRGEEEPELAPAAGVRGAELEEDRQLARGLIVALEPLERARPQPARLRRARHALEDRRQQSQRAIGGGVEGLLRLAQRHAVALAEGALRPVGEALGALVAADLRVEIDRALAQGARQLGGQQRGQPLARLRQPAHAALERRQLERHPLAAALVPAQRRQAPLERGHHLVAPLPAVGRLRQQLGEVGVRRVVERVERDGAAEEALRLPPLPDPAQGVPEVPGDRGAVRVLARGAAEQRHRLVDLLLGQLCPRRLVVAPRGRGIDGRHHLRLRGRGDGKEE